MHLSVEQIANLVSMSGDDRTTGMCAGRPDAGSLIKAGSRLQLFREKEINEKGKKHGQDSE